MPPGAMHQGALTARAKRSMPGSGRIVKRSDTSPLSARSWAEEFRWQTLTTRPVIGRRVSKLATERTELFTPRRRNRRPIGRRANSPRGDRARARRVLHRARARNAPPGTPAVSPAKSCVTGARSSLALEPRDQIVFGSMGCGDLGSAYDSTSTARSRRSPTTTPTSTTRSTTRWTRSSSRSSTSSRPAPTCGRSFGGVRASRSRRGVTRVDRNPEDRADAPRAHAPWPPWHPAALGHRRTGRRCVQGLGHGRARSSARCCATSASRRRAPGSGCPS